MTPSSQSARDILAAFIADMPAHGADGDGALAAVLLEHLLLQGGFKLLAREPDQRMLLAGLPAATPETAWRAMWDAAGVDDPDQAETYTPA